MQALRAKKILQGSELNDEAKQMARVLSLPYLSFENLVGLVEVLRGICRDFVKVLVSGKLLRVHTRRRGPHGAKIWHGYF